MRQHRLMGWGCALLLTACSEALPPEIDPGEAQPGQAIQVGGVVMPGLSVQVETKAQTETPAEQVPWLKKPLEDGLDVFYGLREKFHDNTENAKLRWMESEGTGGTGEYTFYKAGTETPAQWQGNGSHLFRGVYVPSAVRETAPENRLWVKDQSPEATEENPATTNYDHLNHYLAMRANLQIAATLGRIQLPYHHRLARVLTVVLIDPELSIEEGKPVTLKGYELIEDKDDPQSTSIRMDRVDVLDYVSSSPAAREEGAVTMWHPRWTTARYVTPHFFGVVGSLDKDFQKLHDDLLVFRDTKTDDLYFPTTDGWDAMRKTYLDCYTKYKDTYTVQAELEAQIKKETGLTCINYKQAPCYDLILRPTYTSEAMVMYDEAENIDQGDTRKKLAANKNGITYVVELSNNLRYSERIEIDLDAGYQTVVYLRIDREQVDFNQTVAEEWRMVTEADGYYGVNNQHGDRLSIAGGSWQRAYRMGTLADAPITDGSEYNENGNPDHYQDQKPGETHRDGQYLSEDSWKEAFFEAKEDNKHHGDYFVLTQDITIDVSTIPTDFVFTGHLDGRGHTITLTGTRPSDSGTTGGGTEEGGTTPGEGGSSSEAGGTTPGEGGSSAGTGSAGSTTPGEGNALSEEGGASAGTGTEGAGTEGSGTTGSTEGSGSTGSGSTGTGSESGSTGGGSTGGSEGSGSTGGSSGETGGGSEAGGTTPKPVRYLFDGLNGTYDAPKGTANVHEENGTLVPLMGYRAELMNVTIKGGHLFSPAATTTTGYVVGCSDESKQPVDRNPGLGGSD